MFLIVALEDSKKVLVPIKWIFGLNKDTPKLFNYGVTYLKRNKYKIFVSNNFNEEPDFTMKVLDQFKENRSGCYKGSIVKCFGNQINTKSSV